MKTYVELKEALNQDSLANGKMVAGAFFTQIYQTIVIMHFFHLTTSSYAAHMASNTFYTDMPGLLDNLMESFTGRYGKLEAMGKFKIVPTDGLLAVVNLLQWIDANRQGMTDDSEIQNVIDEIVGLCNSTIYKLRELK